MMNLFKVEKHPARPLWLMALLLTLSSVVYAQTGSVTGRVSDEKGELLIGVNVTEKGTANGTVTDSNGQYTLSLTAGNPVLIFTYVGFKPQEVRVGNQRVVDVVIQEDIAEMDEVVVVGYGSQRKISVVGAQSVVTGDILKIPGGNLTSALSGRIAGLVTVQRTGEPGHDNADIWIRGISTAFNQSTSPLILVDGVERSLNNINPDDIESFTVLKDASATAVYGVRGANGVVIITTKPGKVGKPQFSVDYSESFTRLTRTVNMADAYTYMDARNEAQMNTDGTLKYSEAYIEATKKSNGAMSNDNPTLYNPYLYPAVDWAKELFNDWGHSRRGNVSVRGGAPNANYYVSLSYYNETGLTRNFELENYNTEMKYDRYNFTSNLNLKPTTRTYIDLGFGGYLAQGHYPQQSTSTLYAGAMSVNPVLYPLMMPNNTVSGINKDQMFNPYGLLARGGYNMEFSNQLNSNIRITQELDFWNWSKGLKATALIAFDTYNSRSQNYSRSEPMYTFAGSKSPDGLWIEDTLFDENGEYLYTQLNPGADNQLSFGSSQSSNRTVYGEASLNYDRVFGSHRVSGLALYNQKIFWDLNAGDIIGSMPYKQRGYALRATYSWNDRYFGEFNLGINGSENFTPDKRYGVFPAFGLGWAVSNEPFWEPFRNYVSFFKIRYTNGKVGSDTATGRRFMYQGVFTGLPGAVFGTNYVGGGGYGEQKYGVNVTWSSSRKQDLGFDIKFLDDNLSVVVDFFKERRDNIFLQRSTIPFYVGWIENPYANLGIVENKGFEVSIDYNQQLGKKTFLTVRGNLTWNENKIIENGQPPVDYPWMEARGTSPTAIWGYVADGLFTSQEEIEGHARQFGTVHPGDIKYRDLNDDGEINDYDKTVIGRGDVPKLNYGFGADLQIGDFSIGALFSGNSQADRIVWGSGLWPFGDSEGRDNVYSNITDRWSEANPTNQDVFYPRLAVGAQNNNNQQASSWWVKDVSFLRLKQVNISYTLPKKVLQRTFLNSASIYVMGTNLLTFSNFKLWDPELNTSNGSVYPNVSSYSIGARFSF